MSSRGSDRRAEERTECSLEAKIEIENEIPLDCVVKDLSTSGARVQVSPDFDVPALFTLLLPVLPGVDQRFETKLAWRRGDEVGGEFATMPSRDPDRL